MSVALPFVILYLRDIWFRYRLKVDDNSAHNS
ncbi:hypothetical protein ETAA8_23000 [Anatilimnocola aggregata]|uniref:Uncharacterized protein n=1 Tax=Anatilimnocola aggregata TaxID=2528021 RepID=A0A517YAG2_9BACT|nr:hypothetical protein ETAA8_23000 [Anatilimnocola aggregata]